MDPPEQEPPRTDVIVATDGDIILALPNNTYVRVHSCVLSDCSPVFKVMLGPTFLEGQGIRSAAEPKEIQMPEDDEEGMIMLCQLLHKAKCDAPKPLSLLAVARAADKFACVPTVALQTESLISRHYPSLDYPPSEERSRLQLLRTLAGAAYLLRHAWIFYDITKRLVLECTSAYNVDGPDLQAGGLPTDVIRELEIQRTDIRLAVHDDIAQIVRKWTASCHRCGHNEYLKMIAAQVGLPGDVWPPASRVTSMGHVLNKLLLSPLKSSKCSHDAYHYVTVIERNELKEFARKSINSAGLRLADVKSGLAG